MKKLWRKGLASILALAVVAVSGAVMAAVPAHAEDAKGVTVYFQNSKNWSDVYCYTYYGSGSTGKAWPGTEMTKVSGTTNWYSFNYTGDKPLNVVFNDNAKPKAAQTANQKTKDLPLTKNAYWVTLSTGSSQNAGGIGGGVDIDITDTPQAGWPTPAAASTPTGTAATTATAKDTTPKTGDSSNAAAIAIVGAAALAGLGIELFRKKART